MQTEVLVTKIEVRLCLNEDKDLVFIYFKQKPDKYTEMDLIMGVIFLNEPEINYYKDNPHIKVEVPANQARQWLEDNLIVSHSNVKIEYLMN